MSLLGNYVLWALCVLCVLRSPAISLQTWASTARLQPEDLKQISVIAASFVYDDAHARSNACKPIGEPAAQGADQRED